MARKKKALDAEDLELNMTPMIDVVFNLIIFFMIVTDMTQKDIEDLTLPMSRAAEEDKDEQTETRVIINIVVDPDNEDDVLIKIRARTYTLEELRKKLQKIAETKREKEAPFASEVFVLIRCHKTINWGEVQWVMQACANPLVRIYKLEFATAKLEEDD